MNLRVICVLVLAGTCVFGCSKKDKTPVAVAPTQPQPMTPGMMPGQPASTDPAGTEPVSPAADPFGAAPGTEPASPAFPADPNPTEKPDPFGVEPAKPAFPADKPAVDSPFPEPEKPAVKPEPKPEPAKPAEPVQRTWTRKDGKTLQATYVKFEDGKVTITTASGKTGAMPLDLFSDADQEYVKQMSSPQP